MSVVGGEETVLNPTTTTIFNVLFLHDWANGTLGTGLACKETVDVIGSRRALDEDVLHWPETLTTLGAFELFGATRLCI
jgi:hypothetical protein